MFVCTYNSPYYIVSLQDKDILIEEMHVGKNDPEYGVYAVSSNGQKALIAQLPHKAYAQNLVKEIYQKLGAGRAFNPSYARRYNGNPNLSFWG